MRGGLVRDEVRHDAAREQTLEELYGIGPHADGEGAAVFARLEGAVDRAVEVVVSHVEVSRAQPALDALRVHLRDERHGAVHRRGERLRAAHPSQAGRDHEPPLEIAPELLLRGGREGLVGPLKDPLRPDVDPGARGHLAVHRQAEPFQAAELLAGRPGGHEHRVGDEDARSVRMGREHPDGLSGLDEQRLVSRGGA